MKSDYYLRMIEYLSEGKALLEVYTSTDYELQYNITVFLNNSESREYADVMENIIDILRFLGHLSDVRYSQLCMIREETERLMTVNESDIFRFLFAVIENTPLSDVVGKLLYDHYGEIIRQMLKFYKEEDNDESPLQEQTLLWILSDFVLRNITACSISALENGEEKWVYIGASDTVKKENEVTDSEEEDDTNLAERRIINCYFVTIDAEMTDIFSTDDNVIVIPRNMISDDDVCMGDLVTFVKPDRSQAVTFLSVAYYRFEKDRYSVDAYKIRRMPYPILKAEDIEQYKKADNAPADF